MQSSIPEPANAKYDLDVFRRSPLVTMLPLAVIALFLLAGSTTAEVFTNTFLVRMRQPTQRHEADRVALRNGFVNLGPVSDDDVDYFFQSAQKSSIFTLDRRGNNFMRIILFGTLVLHRRIHFVECLIVPFNCTVTQFSIFSFFDI